MYDKLNETTLCTEAAAVATVQYRSGQSSLCYWYLHVPPTLASLKLVFQQEADSGWSNNKQISLYIISLMKKSDFIRMSLWVFLVDLGLGVRISWLHLCLETLSRSLQRVRMSQERAACEPFSFIFESMIKIPQLSRLYPPEATFWIHFIAPGKAKPAKITFVRPYI